jgi:steroid delta-isomerase-like uncharacterized protein
MLVPSTHTKEVSMSTEDVKRLVHAWAEGWSAGAAGIDRFVPLFTEDCVYEDVPTQTRCEGRDQLRVFLTAAFNALPDHRLELTRVVAGEDGAGAEYVVTGTHLGDFPGLPATGKPCRFRGGSVLTVKHGRIHTCADYWDLLSSGIEAPRG